MCNIIKCGICLHEHSDKFHCGVCGAFGPVKRGHRQVYFNTHTGVEMHRVIPYPVHNVVVKFEDTNPTATLAQN